ncbi:hypothetical protein MHOCP_20270 [Moorella humiferrea]|uniref:Uncharacterized protein n=1 Tax=Neomoorella humiferrea TaxID=676965 RepID=A0A2T0ALU2_9FIRM|nr:hypothetical protein [Moorella humiferrea]PRR69715.1 hypothetical protein MOHU_22550 [Moorella humiferrea]
MSADLDALRQRVVEAVTSGKSLGQVFKEIGITPDNPAVVQEIMAQAGIDPAAMFPDGQVDMPSFVNNMTKDLSPEMKKQLAQLIEGMAGEINNGQPLPPDIQEFLKSWQKS